MQIIGGTTKMKTLKKAFEFVFYIHMFMLLLFILENINDLSNITIQYGLSEDIQVVEINLYNLLGTMFVLMIIGIVLSINIFGGGLNSSGSQLAARYIVLGFMAILMFIGSSYYLLSLGWVGVVMQMFMAIIYAMKGLSIMMDNDDDD